MNRMAPYIKGYCFEHFTGYYKTEDVSYWEF